MVGTFEAYTKIVTETKGRRVLEGVFIRRGYINTAKGSGVDSVGPPVGQVVERRKEKDRQGRGERRNKRLSDKEREIDR